MIKLKDLLTEVAWKQDRTQMMVESMIPLTNKVVDSIIGDVDVPTFHVTDVAGLKKIKKLQGKSKALSTFTSIDKGIIQTLSGVKTRGGFLVYMIGKLKIASTEDIMSKPDEYGMRWIPTQHHGQSTLTYILDKVSGSNTGSKIQKDMDDLYYNITKKMKLQRSYDDTTKKYYFHDKNNKIVKVDKVFKEYEKQTIKILKKYQTDLEKYLGTPQGATSGEWTWNELVVDKIMIIDVLGYIDEEYYYDDEAFEYEYNTEYGKDKRKKIEQAKKIFPKLEIATDKDEIYDFLSDRGGLAWT